MTIPDRVAEIGQKAFEYCKSLPDVTIPARVQKIGERAFVGCDSLTAISAAAGNPNYTDVDGVLFDQGMQTLIQYPIGKAAQAYDIPGGLTSIGNNAFSNCLRLTRAGIPNSVTSIDPDAFWACFGMTAFSVAGDNTAYASSEDGVLFDKGQKTLLQ